MKRLSVLLLSLSLYGLDFDYKTVQSDFNQSVTTPDGQAIYYEGKLYVSSPARIKWHYTSPVEKTIWSDGNEITIYEPELIQVTKLVNQEKENFFELIKSAKRVKENLYYKKYQNKTLFFEVNEEKITKIYYKDEADNTVLIELSKQLLDKKLEPSLFTPNYPDYVDVIYQ